MEIHCFDFCQWIFFLSFLPVSYLWVFFSLFLFLFLILSFCFEFFDFDFGFGFGFGFILIVFWVGVCLILASVFLNSLILLYLNR